MAKIYRYLAESCVRWLPALALAAVIGWSSHQSEWPEAAQGLPDWLLHGAAFGALGICVLWGLTRGFRGARVSFAEGAGAVIAASVYGAADEFHQSFIPGRDAAAGDWLADSLGALVAVSAAAAMFAGLRGLWENRPL